MSANATRAMQRANDKRCVSCAVPLEPDEITRGGIECAECLEISHKARPAPKPAPVPSKLAANLAARRPQNQNAGSMPRPILQLPAPENGPLIGPNETPDTALARLEASPAVQTAMVKREVIALPVASVLPAAPLVTDPANRYAKLSDVPEKDKLRALVNAQFYVSRLGLTGDDAAREGMAFAKRWALADSGVRRMLCLELD